MHLQQAAFFMLTANPANNDQQGQKQLFALTPVTSINGLVPIGLFHLPQQPQPTINRPPVERAEAMRQSHPPMVGPGHVSEVMPQAEVPPGGVTSTNEVIEIDGEDDESENEQEADMSGGFDLATAELGYPPHEPLSVPSTSNGSTSSSRESPSRSALPSSRATRNSNFFLSIAHPESDIPVSQPVPKAKLVMPSARVLVANIHNPIAEFKEAQDLLIEPFLREWSDKNTYYPEEILHGPLGRIVEWNVVDLAVNPVDHPILFEAITNIEANEITGIKYVRVIYDEHFSRTVRVTRSEHTLTGRKKTISVAGIVKRKKDGSISKHNGRPHKSEAWQYLGDEKGDCHSCGRRLRGIRGKTSHVDPKSGSQESCEVVRLQRGRDRCYFCNKSISSSESWKVIEAHTKVCKPLWELKRLIHPFHLEDHGLKIEEIDAFEWPGAADVQGTSESGIIDE